MTQMDVVTRNMFTVVPPNPYIVVAGGGGHGKVCIDALRRVGGWVIKGVLDAGLTPGTQIMGISVLGDTSKKTLERLHADGISKIVIGIGNNKIRHQLHTMAIATGFDLPALIHPLADIEASAVLGQGAQILAGAIVGSEAKIGDGCIVNTNAVVSHDCRLENFCHIAPGAVLAGNVRVGEGSLIGMGCTVFMGVIIGRDVTVRNGLHVFSNISEGTLVKGRL